MAAGVELPALLQLIQKIHFYIKNTFASSIFNFHPPPHHLRCCMQLPFQNAVYLGGFDLTLLLLPQLLNNIRFMLIKIKQPVIPADVDILYPLLFIEEKDQTRVVQPGDLIGFIAILLHTVVEKVYAFAPQYRFVIRRTE